MNDLLNHVLRAVGHASEAVLSVYQSDDLGRSVKDDGSPVTRADLMSHEILQRALEMTGIPVVSEEGSFRCEGPGRYWLIDPLDGTKDFLAGNDEFTINVGLIEGEYPALGVLAAPALGLTYFTDGTSGACRIGKVGRERLSSFDRSLRMRMAVSRFHDGPDSDTFARDNGVSERIPIGSALKFAYAASGQIEVYPRMQGSSEWDTAAGQAILEVMCGQVIDMATGTRLRYGKPRARNGSFLAFRAPYIRNDFKWESV